MKVLIGCVESLDRKMLKENEVGSFINIYCKASMNASIDPVFRGGICCCCFFFHIICQAFIRERELLPYVKVYMVNRRLK